MLQALGILVIVAQPMLLGEGLAVSSDLRQRFGTIDKILAY